MLESGILSVSHADLMMHLERRDARLSILEDQVQIWSNIIQDGLADLSMQVKAVARGHHSMEQKDCETKADDSACKRLSDVEILVQATQAKALDDLELLARMFQTEHQILRRLASSQEQQCKHLKEVQDSSHELIEQINVLRERCSRLEYDQEMPKTQFHTVELSNVSQPVVSRADSSSPKQALQNRARPIGAASGKFPRQEPLLQQSQQMQTLQAQRPLHLHAPSQRQHWTCRPCVPVQRLDSRGSQDTALQLMLGQTAVLCAQQPVTPSVASARGITCAGRGNCLAVDHRASPRRWLAVDREACTTVAPRQQHASAATGSACIAPLNSRQGLRQHGFYNIYNGRQLA